MRGGFPLDRAAAADAMRRHVADPLGLSVAAAAEGVLSVVTAKLAGASKAIPVRTGARSRDFALDVFRRRRSLHACEVAEELGMTRVVFPKDSIDLLGPWHSAIRHCARSGESSDHPADAGMRSEPSMPTWRPWQQKAERASTRVQSLRFSADLRYRGHLRVDASARWRECRSGSD